MNGSMTLKEIVKNTKYNLTDLIEILIEREINPFAFEDIYSGKFSHNLPINLKVHFTSQEVPLRKLKECLNNSMTNYNWEIKLGSEHSDSFFTESIDVQFSTPLERLIIRRFDYKLIESNFYHSPDFTQITIHGETISNITPKKAQLLKYVYEALDQGMKYVNQDYLQEKFNEPNLLIKNIWRANDPNRELIFSSYRTESISLNI